METPTFAAAGDLASRMPDCATWWRPRAPGGRLRASTTTRTRSANGG